MRVAIVGDSVPGGLGVPGKSYPTLVAERLGASLVDLTAVAMPITDARERAHQAAGAEVVLIAHGITEALIRPAHSALRFVPPRWRNDGRMDPRPYYSSRLWKRTAQRVESFVRSRVKVALIRHIGSRQVLDAASYERELRALIGEMQSAGSRVVVISTPGMDDRFFPGSAAEIAAYDEINQRVAASVGAEFCDIGRALHRWDDFFLDRFHPNADGHQRIACRVLAILERPLSDVPVVNHAAGQQEVPREGR
jgi:lysophospholipase L1-like esterase